MTDQPLKVGSLLKISLSIEAGTSPDRMDLTASPKPMDFIFGIGTNGITPFEYQLADKACGDRATIHVRRNAAPDMFAHLTFQALRHVPDAEAFYLTATVVGIARPENREVIRAMAEKAGCGDGCDCGCGCGH